MNSALTADRSVPRRMSCHMIPASTKSLIVAIPTNLPVVEHDVPVHPVGLVGAVFDFEAVAATAAADGNRLLSEETVGVERHRAGKRRNARVVGHARSRNAALFDRIRQNAVDDVTAPKPARLRHVAGGPDIRHVRAHQIVDQNAGVDRDVRPVQKADIGLDPGAHQQQIGGDRLAVGERGETAVAPPLDAAQRLPQQHAHAVAGEGPFDDRGGPRFEISRQRMRLQFDDRDRNLGLGHVFGGVHADQAGAQYDRRTGLSHRLPQVDGVSHRPQHMKRHIGQAAHLRQHGRGAGGDQQPVVPPTFRRTRGAGSTAPDRPRRRSRRARMRSRYR